MYAWLADQIIRYRRWILAAMLVLTAIFATTVPKLRFDFTPQQLFQSTSSADAFRETFAERFGREDNLITVAVLGDDIFRPDVLSTMRDVSLELRGLESIKNADSIATFEIPRSGDSPGTMTIAPILPQVSTTESAEAARVSAAEADKLREVALSEPLVRERLVSADGDMALVVAWIRDELQDVHELESAVEAVEESLANHPLPEGYSYRVGGIPTLRAQIVNQLRTEQITFVPMTAVVYMLILIWLFRRVSGVALPLATVFFAVLATVATLVWSDSPINIINNVLPTLIFVIGISDSIHMLARDAEEIEAGKGRIGAVKAMIRHTGLACLLTSCTTAVGFISLLAADSDILQNFGWQAAAGVIFAYIATLLMLPAALSFMKPVKRRRPENPVDDDELRGGAMLERWLVRFGELLLRHPRTVVASSMLLTAGFGALATTVEIDTTVLEVFEEEHPSFQTTRLIEENLGGFLPFEISLESDQKDRFKDPQVYAKMAQLQEFARKQPEVLSTQSLVDFHQSARAALLGDPGERDEMPESRAQVEQLHLMLAGAPDEPAGVNRFVTSDFRNIRILLRVSDVGAKAQLDLARRLEDKLDELFGEDQSITYRLTGDAYVASVALDSFIRDLFGSLLMALVIIFAMMAVVFRSFKLGIISMLPNTIPLVMTFGYMGLTNIDLNTTTIIIFAISLGLAVDDTIHFLARFREEIDRRDTVREAILHSFNGAGRAILLTSVMLVTGMLVLLMSDFIPTRQFGILTSITIGGAILADLVLLPSLLFLVYGGDADETAES